MIPEVSNVIQSLKINRPISVTIFIETGPKNGCHGNGYFLIN